jgi:hypothetical protein
VDAVGSAGEFHDRRAFDDAVQQGHGQLWVAEIFVPGLEVDVGHQGGAGTVTACVDDFVPQARGVRTQTAFDLVEAKLVDDEQVEAGVEAYALVDGVVSQRGGEIFDELAAGDVVDAVADDTSFFANTLDQMAFAYSRLSNEDDVVLAADEVALSEGFELRAWDRWIEVPVEGTERFRVAEVGILDAACDAAGAALAGLIGEQAVQEVEMRPAGLLGFGQGGVELVGGDGEAQRSEVGEDLVTPVRRRGRTFLLRLVAVRLLLGTVVLSTFHQTASPVQVNVDSRW